VVVLFGGDFVGGGGSSYEIVNTVAEPRKQIVTCFTAC